MNVKTLVMAGFMKHRQSSFELPVKGLCVITGPNGGGKSSVVEAVAVSGWGKTLRGTTPWPRDAATRFVSMLTDKLITKRERKGDKSAIEWALVGSTGATPQTYENATKAQEALESMLGSFDLWRRTHVFSSSDASHFTLATDAERKRLVEDVLGNDRFDPALTKCRLDLRTVQEMLAQKGRNADMLKARLQSEEQRLRDAEALLATTPPALDTSAVTAEKNRLGVMVTKTRAEQRQLTEEMRNAAGDAGGLQASLREAQRRFEALNRAKCTTCDQPIPKKLVDQLKVQVDTLRSDIEKKRAEEAEKVEALKSSLDDLTEEADGLTSKLQHLDAQLMLSNSSAEQRKRAETVLKTAALAVDQVRTEGAALIKEVAELQVKAGTLTAVEEVLGLKGVRSRLMARALNGIEVASNRWLKKLAGSGYKLKLKPYTEKKTGGTAEAISLEVEGAGDGNGYRAASQGERRRLDIAMMLGLADMSSAAFGTRPGTLFFDECMDGLDPAGEEAAVAVLAELAAERAVVVITHRPSLAERLPAAARWHVEDGVVT